MTRTQIQLPDPLYREVKRVARELDWSIAEVLRRGAETVVRAYPPIKDLGADRPFPQPLKRRLKVSDPAALRELLGADAEPRP